MEIEKIKNGNIGNGDILIFKYPGILSTEAKKNIADSVRESLGLDNIKILIFDEGLEPVMVLRKDEF